MPENWMKILQCQEEIRKQKGKAFESTKFVKPENEIEKHRIINAEWHGTAIGIVTSILEEIRANSNEIRQARFSSIYTTTGANDYTMVFLKWGNKSGITEEEKRIIKEYFIIDDKKQKQADRLPISFIGEDYYEIGTNIYKPMGDPFNSSLPSKYITSPEKPIFELASQLMNPKHHLKEYFKGTDYWRPPYPDHQPNIWPY